MTTLPSLFISHGAPTFAIEPGIAGAQLRALGRALGKPRAIVVVSPHWMTPRVEITATPRPDTVRDFGGFPRALYAMRYPAPGSPDVAARARQLLQAHGIDAALEPHRGLDHGAWVPLLHLYPDADVPVVQVSMPFDTDEAKAFELGRALAPLAGEGVLVVGSGSLT
ncbi:MAG TPA: class III extradiol ring-cleavage dioxygenase, partial [Ramlibacter sp.]